MAKSKQRDFLAGSRPPYYGVICDRISLAALADGKVLARVQAQAKAILDDEDQLLTLPTVESDPSSS